VMIALQKTRGCPGAGSAEFHPRAARECNGMQHNGACLGMLV
jgi:hypothetical protein